MPTTPRGYPYPNASDAPNIPADIAALATKSDALPGILPATYAQINALSGAELWIGRQVYQIDTGVARSNQGVYTFNGIYWSLPWDLGWGVVGAPASVVADPSPFSTLADVSGLSVGFTAVTNRFYAVTCSFAAGVQNTSTGTSAVIITDGSNNRFGLVAQNVNVAGGSVLPGATRRLVVGGLSPGPFTFKVRATTSAGTLTLHADTGGTYGPMTLEVEDIAPNGDPA